MYTFIYPIEFIGVVEKTLISSELQWFSHVK